MLTRRSFLGTAAAAAATAAPSRPSLLVILCDQLNPAVTSVYGGPVPTPNLERLAKRGVTFDNACCPTPFCSPSRASLVTGLWPHTHGIVHNVFRKDYPAEGGPETEEGLTAADVTVDALLAARGYRTHHYGKWHLLGDRLPYYPDPYGDGTDYIADMAREFGVIRKTPREGWMDWYGWALPVKVDPAYQASYAQAKKLHGAKYSEFISKIGRLLLPPEQCFDYRVASRTMQRIGQLGAEPFSLTCSFVWPHDPNVAPSPWYERFTPRDVVLPANYRAIEPRFASDWSRQVIEEPGQERVREFLRVYYAMTSFIDHQVGRVLDALDASPQARNTVVVFSADHGDMTGGHGMVWKSTSAFFDEIARVPLIVSTPGGVRGSRSKAPVSLTDIPPTLLELAGQGGARMQGMSFAELLHGKSESSRLQFTFGERVRPTPERRRAVARGVPSSFMVRGAGWKYVTYPDGGEFLYDLARDPGETRNLADERSRQALKTELRAELARWRERTEYPT